MYLARKDQNLLRRFPPELSLFHRIPFVLCPKKAYNVPGASRRNCYYFIGFPLYFAQKTQNFPRRFAPELSLFHRNSLVFCSKTPTIFPGASRRNCNHFIEFLLYFAQKTQSFPRRFAPELSLFHRISFVFGSKRPKAFPGASRRNCDYSIGFPSYFAQNPQHPPGVSRRNCHHFIGFPLCFAHKGPKIPVHSQLTW